MEEKYISALEEIKYPEIRDNYTLQSWKSKAINIVTRIYGADSKQEEQINLIKFRTYASFGTISRGQSKTSGGGNNSAHCLKQATALVEGLIIDINNFGIPEKETNSSSEGINITVSQNQSQSVNINIIIDAVQDELNGKQLKEVQKILEQNLDKDTKRNNLVEKLKSFGGNVATNIIASILTNPSIYSGL